MQPDLAATLAVWISSPMTVRLVVLLAGLVAIAVVARLLRRNVSRMVRDNAAQYQVRKGIAFFGYLAAGMLVLLIFSDRLGGLTVAFGVAGAGVAFALQEVIASAAGWMAVVFGGIYRVGDRVRLGGVRGDVIDIGIIRTTLMEIGDWVNADQYNGRIVRVANSFVFKEPVYNYSSDFPFLWDELVVPIKYGSDHALARRLIEQAAHDVVGEYVEQARAAWKPMTSKYLIEPASVEPTVTMVANQDEIEFTLRYVTDYKLRRATKNRLFTRILEAVDRNADRVGIAASSLNIEKHAPIEVRLRRLQRGEQADSPA